MRRVTCCNDLASQPSSAPCLTRSVSRSRDDRSTDLGGRGGMRLEGKTRRLPGVAEMLSCVRKAAEVEDIKFGGLNSSVLEDLRTDQGSNH